MGGNIFFNVSIRVEKNFLFPLTKGYDWFQMKRANKIRGMNQAAASKRRHFDLLVR
jgi:hypothetical protein